MAAAQSRGWAHMPSSVSGCAQSSGKRSSERAWTSSRATLVRLLTLFQGSATAVWLGALISDEDCRSAGCSLWTGVFRCGARLTLGDQAD